jgi:hypothetical protein
MTEADYVRLRDRTQEAAQRQKSHNQETLAGILGRILP